MKTAIIACVKCEERYIIEWIEWHINIGFDHFYLVDNNDADYTPSLESVVKDYVDKGVVTIVDCKGMKPVQPNCYNIVMDKYGDECDWYAVIDIDEFLYLPKHNNIKTFLNGFNNTDVIHIHWVFYGDNDLIYYEEGDVQKRFTKLAKVGKSAYVKSIFRNKSTIESHTHRKMVIDNLHLILEGNDIVSKNCIGDTITTHGGFMCQYKDEEFDVAYLKHYITKSLEEYINTKRKRGAGRRKKTDSNKYTMDFFFIYNEKTQEKMEFLKKNNIE